MDKSLFELSIGLTATHPLVRAKFEAAAQAEREAAQARAFEEITGCKYEDRYKGFMPGCSVDELLVKMAELNR